MLKTKLGNRLSHILSMLENSYPYGWDLCCDHGALGLALLETKKCKHVSFVDQVPLIMESLDEKLKKIPNLKNTHYSLITADAGTISIKNNSLLCLCGVGGDVAIEILESILEKNSCEEISFLISAHYKMFELRTFLKERKLGLLKEELVFDGKWGYEVLLVSTNSKKVVDLVGEPLFRRDCKKTYNYFYKVLKHYERKSKSDEKYLEIFHHYENLFKNN